MGQDLLTQKVIFEANRQAGLDRLEVFAPFAGAAYRNERNYDLGPSDRSNISALSPWIRHRLVTEEDVCARILDDFALSSTEKFIQEVFWRTYWKGWLEMRPSVWTAYEAELRISLENLDADEATLARYRAAIEGRTGIDCFDAWVGELLQTGYLHNHARMWFASIWIFTLRLTWTLGADFFYRHLLDGDAASNTLSWRWVGGLQTLGKHYVARANNIRKFTNGRFEPKGLNEDATALVGSPHVTPAALPVVSPIPAQQRAFVLFNEDDCGAETLDFGTNLVVAGASWNLCLVRSVGGCAGLVHDFTQRALADAGRRMAHAHKCTIDRFEGPECVDDIVKTVSQSGAEIVIAPYTSVGHAKSHIKRLASALGDTGIAFYEVRRDWDTRAWPFAAKGFFAFKHNIPRLLTDAGLDIKGKRSRAGIDREF